MQLKNGQVVLVVLTDRGVNMDKKSLGKVLFNMREQDEVRFVDIENNKEYTVYEVFYHCDNIVNKQVVEFAIREKKKNEKKR